MSAKHTPGPRRINLQDRGQDFLWWDIDAEGGVIDCGPYQGWLWIGTRVHNDEIKRGTRLEITTKSGDETTLNYLVASCKRVIAKAEAA